MPKIDTSTIAGFETMSAEEKLTALLDFDIPERIDLSGYVEKKIFDKTASDLADTKRKLNDKMSADERANSEIAEELRLAQESRDAAQKELSILKTATEYVKLGYSPEMARSASEALCGGDTVKLFEVQRQFNEEQSKKMKEQIEKQLAPGGSFIPDSDKEDDDVILAKKLAKASKESKERSREALEYFIKK